jgi:hypothetical protein
MAYDDAPVHPPDPEAVAWPADVICPVCGRIGIPFDVRVSAVLDHLEVLEAVMHDLKQAAQALAS